MPERTDRKSLGCEGAATHVLRRRHPTGRARPGAPEAVHELLGLADRLRDAEARAGEHPVHGRPHADPVAGRDEERLHPGARPHDRANLVTIKGCRAAAGWSDQRGRWQTPLLF